MAIVPDMALLLLFLLFLQKEEPKTSCSPDLCEEVDLCSTRSRLWQLWQCSSQTCFGRILDCQPRILSLWIHPCICPEATLPMDAPRQWQSTAEVLRRAHSYNMQDFSVTVILEFPINLVISFLALHYSLRPLLRNPPSFPLFFMI